MEESRRMLRARREDERGAVTIFSAFILVVLLGVGALVVDIGMERVARADMQALADVVSLDLARELDGRTVAELTPLMPGLALASEQRNQDVIGYAAHLPDLDVELGTLVDGDFQPMASGVPRAVRVEASTTVDFAFAGITGVATGTTSRQAVAEAQSAACFQVGSYAASITPGAAPFFQDILGPIIGSTTVRMVGYQGLASAHVSLLDIVSAPAIGVGTVDELLAMPSISVGTFFRAMAFALRSDGRIAEAAVLDSAAAAAIPATINLRDLFGLTTASDAALGVQFNALDLLVGAAFLANGTNFIALPNLQAGVPSVGVTSTQFSLIERPRRACDGDEAKTAQARLIADAKLQLNIPLVKTPVIDLKLVGADGKPNSEAPLRIEVEIAGARGRLVEVSCDPDRFVADIWRDLIRLTLTGSLKLKGTVDVNVPPFGLLTVPVAFDVAILADGSSGAVGPTRVDVTYPPQVYGDAVPAPSGQIQMNPVTVSPVAGTLRTGPLSVLGVPVATSVLDAAVNPVLPTIMGLVRSELHLIDPLVAKINDIVGPLVTGMGITLAGADFFGLPTPLCTEPALRG
ncbi:pilus assembly protein TadG-related protein [Nocardioides antri]|uniref:Putative Flp pilus-assembly TadG-like N-terminal domain-containing protein n=1 Tax=Nocardioides antri TaxID=2607659 RepID=A0A5B1M0G8_9ACTN|nr:pilus assembly protein TadG-related protein [Nocardioides antri]KAA1426274.1 hypothetical protein F0U47_15340 [Nocardioides antri]